MKVNDFTCRVAMPGIGCNYPEMIILGLLFLIVAGVSFYYIIKLFKDLSSKFVKLQLFLWISMVIWLIYKAIMYIVPFNYNITSFKISYVCVPIIMFIIPVFILIGIESELLFLYNRPSQKVMTFVHIFLVGVVTILLISGIIISILEIDNPEKLGASIALWYAIANIITVVLLTIPGIYLFRAINEASSEYERCINKSIAGLFFFDLLCFTRGIYNILSYVKWNPVQDWVNNILSTVQRTPPGSIRAFTFSYYFIFDGITAVLLLVGAVLMLNHSTNIATDPFFARQISEELIL